MRHPHGESTGGEDPGHEGVRGPAAQPREPGREGQAELGAAERRRHCRQGTHTGSRMPLSCPASLFILSDLGHPSNLLEALVPQL